MDEMNNVTMENETSVMENAPVESLVPAAKKGFKHIKEKMASKKADKDDVEFKDVTSDEETCEEEK